MSGAGILIVWTDIAPEIEADFNAWYNHEHLPDRVGRMPGFLRGRRYVLCEAIAGAPKFLTLYDLQSAAVMQSDAHVALRKNRSERDRYFVPRFRHAIKGICDVVCRAGRGGGEFLVLLPLTAVDDAASTSKAGGALPGALSALSELAGVTGATYASRNADITAASSARDDRAGDRYVDGLLCAEAQTLEAAQAAAAWLTPAQLIRAGVAAQFLSAPCVLRLIHTLEAPAAPV